MALNFNTTTNSTRYVTLPNMAIPASDFAIIFAAKFPVTATSFSGNVLFSLGNQSATIQQDNGKIIVSIESFSQSGGAYSRQLAVCMVDDAGNVVGNRAAGNYLGDASASVQLLTGPLTDITNDMISRPTMFAITSIGGVISLWTLYNGSCANQFTYDARNTFGTISSKPVLLGALNNSPISNFCQQSAELQRFIFYHGTVTATQLEAIGSGQDPVATLGLTNANNDEYWSFDGTTAVTSGQVFASQVPGRTSNATIQGSGWATATEIIPTTPITDNARVTDADWGQVIHSFTNPATIQYSGTFAVATPSEQYILQVQLIDFTTTAIVVDWTTVASNITGGVNASGSWSGSLSGVPRGLQWFTRNTRLVKNGTPGSTLNIQNKTGVGITVEFIGQSLAEKFRDTSPTYTVATGAAGFTTLCGIITELQGETSPLFPSGPNINNTSGYGEAKYMEQLATIGNCNAMSMNDAVGGSTIAGWVMTPSPILFDPMNFNVNKMKPGFIIWHQGQGSVADGYALYLSEMQQLYAKLRANISGNWQFGVLPLNDTQTAGQNYGLFDAIRRAQIDFVTQTIAGGDNTVFLVGGVNDPTLVDGTHATQTASGFGEYAERMGQTILNRMSLAIYSGVGPQISSISWIPNSASLKIKMTQNGGTGLQSPLGGQVTGFRVGTDAGMGTLLTINSATITGMNEVTIVLSAIPSAAPWIDYQFGAPINVTAVGSTALVRASNTVTASITAHGRSVGDQVIMTQMTNTSFNGTFTLLTASVNSFTYAQTAANATSGGGAMSFGMANPVYDNRVPYINTTLGFPVEQTSGALASVLATISSTMRLPIPL